MDDREIFELSPYALDEARKTVVLNRRMKELTAHHMKNCPEYKKMMESIGFDAGQERTYYEYPFLPVRLFKEQNLKSVSAGEVFKTMTSSGTSGQAVSKIYLDRATAGNQQKAMVKIVSSFTGALRMPMLIIDSPSVLRDRKQFSARGAGILGFSVFGRDRLYALDDAMNLDKAAMAAFLEKHAGETILLFGFTFMVWQHFYKELKKLAASGTRFDLSNGILIHGGGWKKMEGMAVSQGDFKEALQEVCGLTDIHDYYGMVEQTGCIYMECECGHLHASIYSDVIMRRAKDFSICGIGECGILQAVSILPQSYPGHSLLTEDEGVVLGTDDCPCGRKGKYFKVLGRLKNAELRGCSDTYAAAKFD